MGSRLRCSPPRSRHAAAPIPPRPIGRSRGTWESPTRIASRRRATPEQKKKLSKLDRSQVRSQELAGDRIEEVLTRAPGNDAPIGGLKVCTANGWFAARPSGTEDIYKIYGESFRDEAHLRTILSEAQSIVDAALAGS